MIGRVYKAVLWTLSSVAFFVIVAFLAVAAVTFASPFEGVRQSAAADLLQDVFKRSVAVTGPVEISLGPTIRVKFADVEIEAPDWAYEDRP